MMGTPSGTQQKKVSFLCHLRGSRLHWSPYGVFHFPRFTHVGAPLPNPSLLTIHASHTPDVPTILQLINELASYEHALHEVLATEQTLLSTLSFPSNPSRGYAKTLLITPRNSATPVGMALYFHNYSTWHAAPGIYLEDLLVRPE